jgi:hypothetical protein
MLDIGKDEFLMLLLVVHAQDRQHAEHFIGPLATLACVACLA